MESISPIRNQLLLWEELTLMVIARLATLSSLISSITNLTSQVFSTKHQKDFTSLKPTMLTKNNQSSLRRTTVHHWSQLPRKRDLKLPRKRRETKFNLKRKMKLKKQLKRKNKKKLKTSKIKMMFLRKKLRKIKNKKYKTSKLHQRKMKKKSFNLNLNLRLLRKVTLINLQKKTKRWMPQNLNKMTTNSNHHLIHNQLHPTIELLTWLKIFSD